MKIRIKKSADIMIGSLRVSAKVYNRIQELSKKAGVSNQEVMRAILDEVIDKVEV